MWTTLNEQKLSILILLPPFIPSFNLDQNGPSKMEMSYEPMYNVPTSRVQAHFCINAPSGRESRRGAFQTLINIGYYDFSL